MRANPRPLAVLALLPTLTTAHPFERIEPLLVDLAGLGIYAAKGELSSMD